MQRNNIKTDIQTKTYRALRWWNNLSPRDQNKLIEMLQPAIDYTKDPPRPKDIDLIWMHRGSMTKQEWNDLNKVTNDD